MHAHTVILQDKLKVELFFCAGLRQSMTNSSPRRGKVLLLVATFIGLILCDGFCYTVWWEVMPELWINRIKIIDSWSLYIYTQWFVSRKIYCKATVNKSWRFTAFKTTFIWFRQQYDLVTSIYSILTQDIKRNVALLEFLFILLSSLLVFTFINLCTSILLHLAICMDFIYRIIKHAHIYSSTCTLSALFKYNQLFR